MKSDEEKAFIKSPFNAPREKYMDLYRKLHKINQMKEKEFINRLNKQINKP